MGKRVLLAGLFHETHTFLSGTTSLADFAVLRGEELLQTAGDASPLAGAVETAHECGWEIVPAIDFRAEPSAIVEDEVVELWWDEFDAHLQKALSRGKLDGIFLVLHGAMAAQTLPDVEGELLRRIRDQDSLQEVPIFGVTDLHANISPLMAGCTQGLITYRKNPHTDARETAVRAVRLMDAVLERRQFPTTLFAHPPILWPPTGTGTADEPMRTLEDIARQIEEEHPDILAVNVHAGFSFADTPHSGVSFTIICVGELENAQKQLQRLCDYALAHKDEGNVIEPPIESVMEEVKGLIIAKKTPVVLVEPSDNIGGGAPGDGTGVLRALLAHNIQNSAVVLNDPEAVQQLSQLKIGERLTLKLGDTVWQNAPLVVEVELLSRSDGRFELEDAQSHLASMRGLHIDMGECAVVRCNGVTILLTSKKTAPMDLGQLRSQGIIPEELSAIGVKAAVAHRRAYDPIAGASFTVNTPGPCSSDLKSLPFQHLIRPIFPLD